MPTMANPETGETKEISMEEFLQMMRSGNAEIRQVVTHADGTTTSNTLFGNLAEDGIDRSTNIFVDKETFNAFIKRSLLILAGQLQEENQEPDSPESLESFEMTIDFTHTSLMGIMKKTDTEVTLDLYTRDDRKSTSAHLLQESKTWAVTEDGTTSLSSTDFQGEDKNITLYLLSFSQMRKFLRRTGKLEELKKLGNRGSGVIIRATDRADDATATIVQGPGRPDLPCEMFLLGEQLMRPYPDELMSGMYKELTHEEKIEAAENGNTGLMEELAMYYLNGDYFDNVQPDPEKAFYWFSKLAEAGVASGMFNLGLHYAKGHGTKRDFEQAVYWMQKAADAGDEDAPALVEKYQKAIVALDKVSAGDAQAQADLAGVLMALAGSLEQAGPGKDYEEAFELAQKSAAQNNGDGIWALALAYEHGRGVRRNVAKAIEYYRKGADMGHAASQHSLACYYMRGEKVQKDMELAFDLILKSANQGYGLAMKDAGRCYQFGHGTADDMAKAIEWYEKALAVLPDPELEQKVAVFKTLQGHQAAAASTESTLPEDYTNALQSFMAEEEAKESTNLAEAIRWLNAEFDPDECSAFLTEEVVGTQFEGRNQRIERIRVGEKVELVREPQNTENGLNISVRNKDGQSLGNLSVSTCRLLAPLMDEHLVNKVSAVVCEVIPLSKRGGRAKKSILKLTITIDLSGKIPCMVCRLAGDQVNIWAQQLIVNYCTMPTKHAKLLFELYNRSAGEYDKLDQGENDTSYAGLDNLEEEIRAAREQMQQQRVEGQDYSSDPTGAYESFGSYVLRMIGKEAARYGALRRYEIQEYDRLQDILSRYALGEKRYYWVDQTRIGEEEFNAYDGFNHWYEVMELYDGTKLPVDMNDEDVVSIFGCGKFAAFADLSYGC